MLYSKKVFKVFMRGWLGQYGIAEIGALRNTRKGYWAVAGSGILHHTITNERLARRGYYDISEAYKSVHSI